MISLLIVLSLLYIILAVLYGIADSIIDTICWHYNSSVFYGIKNKYWKRWFAHPDISYLNKYKDRDPIKLEPKYWGATHVFVSFTDAFHLSHPLVARSFLISSTR